MVRGSQRDWSWQPALRLLRRPRRLPATWLLALAGLVLLGGGFLAGYLVARQTTADLALLFELRGLLESSYYRPADAEPTRLLRGAARGMVQALGDPNTFYVPPAERQLKDVEWGGRYDGVGIYVDQHDGQLVVTSPIEDGPAARAGLRSGDIVLEVDGELLAGLSLAEQVLSIRGPRSSTVVLTIRRENVPDLLRIALVREEIHRISVRGAMLPEGIGVLRISHFTDETAVEARTELERLLAEHPRALLLDLRNSGGGLIGPAVQVAGYFLGPGPVLQTHARGTATSWPAPDEPALTDLPLSVLIDHGTASASEILAAALHDRGRADLLGERSFGKATTQSVLGLSDGSGLRLTVAEWRSPSGRPLPATGLEPDLAIPAPDPPPAEGDPVLDAAIQHLLTRSAEGGR